MTIVDPGNPDTSSFAMRRVADGSALDPYAGQIGFATHYERVSLVDPNPDRAANMATALLEQYAGAVASVTLVCIPQPWLTVGDVIVVDYNHTRFTAQVVGWSMDIGPESTMRIDLRTWRVVSDVDLPVYPSVSELQVTANAAMPLGVDAVRQRDVAPPVSPVEPEE